MKDSQNPTILPSNGQTEAEPSAACGCVATMNEALKPHNTALVVPLMGPPRCLVEGYQIQGGRGSKRAVKVFANYCPFCGDKYAREDDR